MSLLGAIMTRDLVIARREEPVSAAIDRLSSHDVGALLVVEDGELTGILSERDIVRRVLPLGLEIEQVRVGDVATGDPVAIAPDTPIGECVRLIQERGFRHLPVVNGDRHPVGILSSRDLLQFVVEGLERTVERQRAELHREEMTDPYDCLVV